MDNDDVQLGRILSRREVLRLLGATGAVVLTGCGPQQANTPTAAPTVVPSVAAAPTAGLNAEAQTAEAMAQNPTAQTAESEAMATAEVTNTEVAVAQVPACVVRPEVTEGPYYVDLDLVRSDIRTDSNTGEMKPGTPLTVTFNVFNVSENACTPFEGATVEIWHCDANGVYSGVVDPGFTTQGQNWLRGAQITDSNGVAMFTTIYPGWYSGRAVHIHFKIHPAEDKVFTSQIFFENALSYEVYTKEPYVNHGDTPDTTNETDSIYQPLLMSVTAPNADGYAATFDIGVDLSTVGTGESNGPGGPGRQPPGNGGPGRPPPPGSGPGTPPPSPRP